MVHPNFIFIDCFNAILDMEHLWTNRFFSEIRLWMEQSQCINDAKLGNNYVCSFCVSNMLVSGKIWSEMDSKALSNFISCW